MTSWCKTALFVELPFAGTLYDAPVVSADSSAWQRKRYKERMSRVAP